MPRSQKTAVPPSRPPVPQAENFRRLRRDHAVEIAQDYAEAIADLRQPWARRAWWISRAGWA